MSFSEIQTTYEKAMDKICDGKCKYPVTAAKIYMEAIEHICDPVMEEAIYAMIDNLYSGKIGAREIPGAIADVLPDNESSLPTQRDSLYYTLEIDQVSHGRLDCLEQERRREFVLISTKLAETCVYPADMWAEHFIQSAEHERVRLNKLKFI